MSRDGAEPSVEGTHPGRCTVLVVEDDPYVREVLDDVLDGEGYRVVTAENGRDGLARLASGVRPCLVLLDLMMPVMSGGEFLDVLRADDELDDLPVVVVSAWPEEARKVSDKTQGWVRKPMSLDVLLETVAAFCKTARDRPCPAGKEAR